MMIPILTTDAGRCLTIANWKEVGVELVSYQLTSLLMKPGFEGLNALPNLAAYVGWPGAFVLNASMSVIDESGAYPLRSSYDGSRCCYTVETLMALIGHLNPPFVILPEGIHQQNRSAWLSLPDDVFPFFLPEDMPASLNKRAHGVHLHYDGATLFTTFLNQAWDFSAYTRFVSGELSVLQLKALTEMGIEYIESDVPARDATQGMVYHPESPYSIQDESMALLFDAIDSTCRCPTCSQGFTRAYLHHLLMHTPLLCQRLLIQHNLYYCQASFTPA